MPDAAGSDAPLSFRALVSASSAWLRRSWMVALIAAMVAFGVATMWNMWLMATRLQGHRVPPGRGTTTATADGHGYNIVYWLLVAAVVCGGFSYWRERGFRSAARELVTAPKRVLDAVNGRPTVTIGLFLWGMSLSLVVAVVLTQAMTGVLAVGLLLAAPSRLAPVVDTFFVRVWSSTVGNFAPQARGEAEDEAAPLVVMLGQGFGMAAAFLSGSSIVDLLLAMVCAGLSYVVVIAAARSRPTPGVVVLVVGAAVALAVLFVDQGRAFADGGGWQTCTYDGHRCSHGLLGPWEWFRSPGAVAVVGRSLIAGFGAAAGAVLGAAAGGATASVGSGGPAGPGEPGEPAGPAEPPAG